MPIADLQAQLKKTLDNFDLPSLAIGDPKAVEKAVQQVARTFENYAAATPPQDRSYAAALKFLRGCDLSVSEKDWIAAALNQPIKEQGGGCVLESGNFRSLINHYQQQIDEQSIWRLAWYWLLLSYFNIEISTDANAAEKRAENGEQLRVFLEKSYKLFSEPTKEHQLLPRWAKTLYKHPTLLSKDPCAPYAETFLEGGGNTEVIDQVKNDISIPRQSWFWHELTLAVVKHATANKDDDLFKRSIKQLIDYLEEYPGFRDQAIKSILERYYECKDTSALSILRDYVVKPEIWKNPKLRNSGIASKWHYVDGNIWRMVLAWITKEHLRLFFEVLAERNGAQKDRFQFWSQYINQITYTKLVFGATTQSQKARNSEIAKLFREEQDIYAVLKANDGDLDAFIMQIGKYTFVEFSMNGNAGFIYKNDQLPFNLKARRLNDGGYGDGLKYVEYGLWDKENKDNRILHIGNWRTKAKKRLIYLNIYPDITSN